MITEGSCIACNKQGDSTFPAGSNQRALQQDDHLMHTMQVVQWLAQLQRPYLKPELVRVMCKDKMWMHNSIAAVCGPLHWHTALQSIAVFSL